MFPVREFPLWLSGYGRQHVRMDTQLVGEEMAEVRSLDIVLRTNSEKDIRLRVVGKPEKHLSLLLHQLRLPLPNKAKMLQNVVETLDIN